MSVGAGGIMRSWHGGLIVLCFMCSVFGQVHKPKNVHMDSVNFKSILRWEPGRLLDGNRTYTYTAQYKLNIPSIRNYSNVCVGIQETHCDFSRVRFDSLLRVRAELNESVSGCVQILFDPYTQTIISAPTVKVTSRAGHLDVSFFGPIKEPENLSLKTVYGSLYYNVLYWKASSPSEVTTVTTEETVVILHKLEKWTDYCIKVQAAVPVYYQVGQFSEVICEKTKDDGKTEPWKIVLLFIGSMLIVTAVVIGIYYLILKTYKTTRYIFFASYSFPEHLKEYLNNPFYTTSSMLPIEESVETCEQLTFISEEKEDNSTTA
ncbi:interleukin-10 receptor subunit beta [Bombina bombina]|uniref:interleukin-10 receptor subunit beta n=1 Tax=Bombina bombina TaxID=8345 RepID=UPI00235A83D2|nr:interleukin-10 receptor subunit beta [Bombina bombina]